ncbi:MAG: hypothetical protein AAF609_14075 [Cyanobacteria bacterium P01_C01_bin.120]
MDDVWVSKSLSASHNVTSNVTTETAIQQGFQSSSDKSDVCDVERVSHSNCGEWVFHRGMNTPVELVSLNQQTARVKIPGLGMRDADIEDLEVLEDGAA